MAERAVPAPGSAWTLEEILVIDNNPDGSAKPVVTELAATTGAPLRYVHEPQPGIVAARNKALDEANGEVLVFIDDDEVALEGWPDGLLQVMARTGAAMVGGPVESEFVAPPPQWVVETGYFKQPSRTDGSQPTWLSTCNVAIDLVPIRAAGLRFDPRFPHGEDAMFSRQAARLGLGLGWSASAMVREFVDPERTTVQWRRNRHRISTDAWVRTNLALDPSIRTELSATAKAAWRLVEGTVTSVAGVVTGNRARRYAGLALISQARGGIEGVLAHRRQR